MEQKKKLYLVSIIVNQLTGKLIMHDQFACFPVDLLTIIETKVFFHCMSKGTKKVLGIMPSCLVSLFFVAYIMRMI